VIAVASLQLLHSEVPSPTKEYPTAQPVKVAVVAALPVAFTKLSVKSLGAVHYALS